MLSSLAVHELLYSLKKQTKTYISKKIRITYKRPHTRYDSRRRLFVLTYTINLPESTGRVVTFASESQAGNTPLR